MRMAVYWVRCGKRILPMSSEQYALALHELARVLPEEKRQNFLEILRNSINPHIEEKDRKSENLSEEISESLKALEQIENGKKLLHGELNEEYDDWYNSDDEEFIFSDPQGLLNDIETAIQLLHTCVDQAEYKLGYRLADTLSTVFISADGEYAGYMDDPFDLYAKDLLV